MLRARAASIFSAVFRLDQIPDEMKKMAISLLDENLNKEKQKEIPGETKTQTELRRKMTDAMGQRMAQVIQEAGELALSFDVNRQAQPAFAGEPGARF